MTILGLYSVLLYIYRVHIFFFNYSLSVNHNPKTLEFSATIHKHQDSAETLLLPGLCVS